MTRHCRIAAVLTSVLVACLLSGCGQAAAKTGSGTSAVETAGNTETASSRTDNAETTQNKDAFTADTKIDDVIGYPAFGDWGRLIFPVNKGYYSGDTLGQLNLTWYTEIRPEKTVEICNYFKDHTDAGEVVFYDIYTEEEKASDPSLKDTGIFFFRGEPGAKFAVCNSGGGMVYVGSMHDSFPHALELSKMGYNAFACIYRAGYETGPRDCARAVAFIIEHAEELQVDPNDYSLWGGSAGARIADWVGTYGTAYYGEKDYPQAAAVIMQYTALSEVTGNEPATYNCVGTRDGIAPYTTMQERIDRISANGTDTMIEVFDGLSHGFGIATGTVAEGWVDHAASFWERNMKAPSKTAASLPETEKEEFFTLPETGAHRLTASESSLPSGYTKPLPDPALQGRVERFDYATKDYVNGGDITKAVFIYLPAGYDDTENGAEQYDILYFMHGYSGTAHELFAFNGEANKNMLDHMIADGQIRPLIVVAATWNVSPDTPTDNLTVWPGTGNGTQQREAFWQDFRNDLMPAIERKYRTFADLTETDSDANVLNKLMYSRTHRGFSGFSYGGVTTWWEFRDNFDYISYFAPFSAYSSASIAELEAAVNNGASSDRSFAICSATGTNDVIYSSTTSTMDSVFGSKALGDHAVYYIMDGAAHDFEGYQRYLYKALQVFYAPN